MAANEHAAPDRSVPRRRLLLVLALVGTFLIVEALTAFLSGSLTLLSDAGHMLTDAVGLAMAWAAISVATRTVRADHRTYGRYRLEMLAAAGNAVLLLGIGGYAIIEGLRRLSDPPAVDSGPMLVVATVGLVVNVIGLVLLREPSRTNLNLEGARLEVLADLLGSIAAVAAALSIRFAGWAEADPLFGIALGAFVVPRSIGLGRRALRVLMQHAPEGVDVDELNRALADVEHVVDVHDLHVWTLTSQMDVASVHLTVDEDADLHRALDRARGIIEGDFALTHATIQIEPESHSRCVEAGW